MKQVFEQYGGAVVAVLLATVIYVFFLQENILQGKTIPQLLGEVLSYSVEEEDVRSDAFAKYMQEGAPRICRREGVWMRCNERVELTDLFEAQSARGLDLPIYLQQAWTLSGETIDLGASEDRTSICISQAGVYWLQLYAVDEKGNETRVMLKLPVNKR